MRRAGQIAILRFPTVALTSGKPRPVLLVAPVPGPYDDWLVCMLSTQLQQAVEGFDEVIDLQDSDFLFSGLKVASVGRLSRLAVVLADTLVEAIGEISPERLQRIRRSSPDGCRAHNPTSNRGMDESYETGLFDSSASSALASWRSAVSKPSVNQLYTSATSW